jgi:hypothetical protein
VTTMYHSLCVVSSVTFGLEVFEVLFSSIPDHGLPDPAHPKNPDLTRSCDESGTGRNFHLNSKNNPTQPENYN